MATIDYDKALNEWAANKLGVKSPEYVGSVEVTTIDEGYCETCSYTRAAVVANVYKTAKDRPRYAGERELDIEPAALVREVSEYIARQKP